MSEDKYIPVGRTSLARNGQISLHVQTEYALRPYPRITTTVLNNGEVVQKIEKRLNHPVSSPDEQNRAEALIQRQHADVLSVIEKGTGAKSLKVIEGRLLEKRSDPLYERLQSLPGFCQLYRLKIDGTFLSENTARQFKRAFPAAFKHLRKIIDLFPVIPGGLPERKRGVYEVERESLYLISAGHECFFVAIQPIGDPFDFEAALQMAIMAENT